MKYWILGLFCTKCGKASTGTPWDTEWIGVFPDKGALDQGPITWAGGQQFSAEGYKVKQH